MFNRWKRKSGQHHVSVIFLAVGIVSFWRGVWELSNAYLFPQDPLLSNAISILAGLGIIIISYELLDKNTFDHL